jgi:hypothetical protein
LNDELQYHVLKHLQAHPQASQLELARALGISLGRTNHCVRAVIEQKTRILARFLKRKQAEYQALQAELEQLTAEAKA